jgi:hypothetical protein
MIVVNLGILTISQEHYHFMLVLVQLEPMVTLEQPLVIVDMKTTIDTEKNPGNNLGNHILIHNIMKTLILIITLPLLGLLYFIWIVRKFTQDFTLSFDEWLEDEEQLFPSNRDEDDI